MMGSAAGRFPGRPPMGDPDEVMLPAAIRDQVVAVVGAGRLGTAMVSALQAAGVYVSGPHGRGFDGQSCDIVLLCVPDDQIGRAAALLHPGLLVGHCSGASGLSVLQPASATGEAFSLHPLITATASGTTFAGAPAAVAGSSDPALSVARALAAVLGLQSFSVAEEDRAAYHAAAAMAANFLVTLEWAAARLLESASVDPAVVLPLARQALANWAALGSAALTGPVARGDVGTIAAHRNAVDERTPDLLPLFDELVSATRHLAGAQSGPWSNPVEVKGSSC